MTKKKIFFFLRKKKKEVQTFPFNCMASYGGFIDMVSSICLFDTNLNAVGRNHGGWLFSCDEQQPVIMPVLLMTSQTQAGSAYGHVFVTFILTSVLEGKTNEKKRKEKKTGFYFLFFNFLMEQNSTKNC